MSLGTIERTLKLLNILADHDSAGITVQQAANALGLAPSSTHRLLQIFKAQGFVTAPTKGHKYRVGSKFYRISARVIDNIAIPSIAQAAIEPIAAHFDETVLFGLYVESEQALSFEARADGSQRLKYEIDLHTSLSLVWGASGKAILAFLPPETIEAILAKEVTSPGNGTAPPSLAALNAALGEVRQRGYAISESEKLPGARGIAVPVFVAGHVMGSLCLTSPMYRVLHSDPDLIGSELRRHAKSLSRTFEIRGHEESA